MCYRDVIMCVIGMLPCVLYGCYHVCYRDVTMRVIGMLQYVS